MSKLIESKAECPYCERHILLEEIETKWLNQSNPWIRLKCKCNRFIGISDTIPGNFIAFKLIER